MLTRSFQVVWLRVVSIKQLPIACIILFSSLLLYSIFTTIHPFFETASSVPLSIPVSKRPISAIPNIAQWHLFGEHEQIKGVFLPETRLDLTLKGIFYSTNAQGSQALISAPNKPAKLYVKGQALPGGGTIQEVLETTVIIEHNGNQERLVLPKLKLDFKPVPVQSPPPIVAPHFGIHEAHMGRSAIYRDRLLRRRRMMRGR